MQLPISQNYHVEKCIYREETISLFLIKNTLSEEQMIVQQLGLCDKKLLALEYKKIMAVKHPNIIEISSVQSFKDQFLVTWRYISHISLNQFATTSQNLSDKVSVILQLLSVVEKIIKSELFSGTLHPQNIIYTKQKKIVAFYFGLFTCFPEKLDYAPHEDEKLNTFYALGIFIYQIMCQTNSTIIDGIDDHFAELSFDSQQEQLLNDTLRQFVKQCVEGIPVNICWTSEFLQKSLEFFTHKENECGKKTLPFKYQGKAKVGKHYLESVLGQGAAGTVYKAWDEKLKRNVALKLLHEKNKRLVVRFKREIDVVAKLDHPHIVKLYEIHLESPIHFTMQYIAGARIDDYIDINRPSFSEIAKIFAKILSAIECAHENKIIHRDLKPSNLLVDKNGDPFIMDFGIAKIDDSQKVTKTGELVGTLFYMSPEQAKASKDIDVRSDLYSIGVILYQVLTKKLPFEGNTPIQVMHQIATGQPTTPRKMNKDIPSVLEKICLKAMQKKRESRYQTAEEMLADINCFIEKNYGRFRFNNFLHGCYRFFTFKYVRFVTAFTICVFAFYTLFSFFSPESESPALFFSVQSEKYFMKKYQEGNLERKVYVAERLIPLKNKLKKYKEVIRIYREIQEQNLCAVINLEAAKAFYFLGDNDTALTLLHKSSLQESTGEVFYYHALIFYFQEQFSIARKLFDKAILHDKNKKNPPQIHLYLGICNVKLSNLSMARKHLKIATTILSQDVRTWKYLGKSYLPKNLDDEVNRENMLFAYECFVKCIDLDPSSSEYYTLAAQSKLYLQKYNESYYLVKAALEKNPSDIAALNTMLQISYKEPLSQYDGYTLQRQSVGSLIHVGEPDLFASYFDELEKIYYDDFINRSVALQQKPYNLQVFLDPLTNKTLDREVLLSIAKGIVSLRYQKNIKHHLQAFRKKAPKFAQRRLDRILSELQRIINNEQKYATYYKISHLYKKIKQKHMITNEKIESAQAEKIFDTEKSLAIKYATAVVMTHTCQWNFLQKMLKSKNKLNNIIICCALRKTGYYQPLVLKNLFAIADTLSDQNRVFFLSTVAKNITIYSVAYPQQVIPKNHIAILKKLILSETPTVQLCAAASVFSISNSKKMLRGTSEKVLLEAMDSSSKTIRAYTHYHFWNSYHAQSSPSKYRSFLQKGMQDEELCVNSCVMKNAPRYMSEMGFLRRELVSLIHRNTDNKLGLQSILILVLLDPSHAEVLDFHNNEKHPGFFRVYTFILAKYFFTLHNIKTNPLLLVENVKKLLAKSKGMLKLKKNEVKAFFYYATASWGYHPLDIVKKEKDSGIIANIIANLKLPPPKITMIKRLVPDVSKRQKYAILQYYKDKKEPAIQKSILSVRVYLASHKKRQAIYKKVKNGTLNDKIAAADGFYSILLQQVFPKMKEFSGYQSLLEEEQGRAYTQSFYGFMKDLFLYDYKRFSQYKMYMQYALNLDDRKGKYFYEMAILNVIENSVDSAIKNLRKALEISPDSSKYCYRLAEIMLNKSQDSKKLLPILMRAEKNTRYIPLLGDIANVYMKLKMWRRAENTLQKMLLIGSFLTATDFLDLVRICVLQKHYSKARKHLQCIIDVEKRKSLNNENYETIVTEELLNKDSVLRLLNQK
ncbi:protein kinase [Candidatus Uabimicrobium sp. HlEnr_7]|uniref:protein kinase domain-containing protein n=1 Tax=Candidatus Uabimicrobium helgolandensis TaxID=3095367 RepID=UPI0035591C40